MGLLIGAGVVLLTAAAFLLCHLLVQREDARFEQEKRPGRAVVHHYSRQSEHGSALTMMVRIPEQDAYCLGQLFYFFEFACGVSGYLSGVNPFDQPGVEGYKKNMFALLGKPGYEDLTKELQARL